MMASRDGKIVIENTLDARLDVVFRKKLPEVFLLTLHSFVHFYCNCDISAFYSCNIMLITCTFEIKVSWIGCSE